MEQSACVKINRGGQFVAVLDGKVLAGPVDTLKQLEALIPQKLEEKRMPESDRDRIMVALDIANRNFKTA